MSGISVKFTYVGLDILHFTNHSSLFLGQGDLKYGTSNALLQFRNSLNLENGSLVGKTKCLQYSCCVHIAINLLLSALAWLLFLPALCSPPLVSNSYPSTYLGRRHRKLVGLLHIVQVIMISLVH